MSEITPSNQAKSGIEVRTWFVRNRNALLVRADISELYVDYYLHLGDQQIRPSGEADGMFKRALAAFVLHCASRPLKELTAWTINFQQPLLNIFLTGDNETGDVAGRVFKDNVKQLPQNLFYVDVVRGREPKRRSVVPFDGADPVAAAEIFYAQSEQRAARFFQLNESEFVLLIEHPDCDVGWFRALTTEQARELAQTEVLVPMERRVYRWQCGCTHRRMMEVLAPTMRQSPRDLFGDDEKLEMRCPRCGARHAITREALEAFVADTK